MPATTAVNQLWQCVTEARSRAQTGNNLVISGCAPSAGGGLAVNVGTGVFQLPAPAAKTATLYSTTTSYAGGTVTLDAAPASGLYRRDIVYFDSSGVLQKLAGSAAAYSALSPSPPFLPVDGTLIAVCLVASGDVNFQDLAIEDWRQFGPRQTYFQGPSPWIDVKAFGAKGDGKIAGVADGAITSGQTAFTISSSQSSVRFSSADVGKTIVINSAGAAGAPLVTTITAYVSETAVTVGAAASATVTASLYSYGTDDTTALQNALNATPNTGVGLMSGGVVYFPTGMYHISAVLNVAAFTVMSGQRTNTTSSGAVIRQVTNNVDTIRIIEGGDFLIENIMIFGLGVGTGAGIRIGDAVTPHLTSGGRIRQIGVQNINGTGILLENASDITITDSDFETNGIAIGARLASGSQKNAQGIRINGNLFYRNQMDCILDYGSDWTIVNNEFSQAGGPGYTSVEAHVRSTAALSYMAVVGNTFDQCGSTFNVEMQGGYNILVGNLFRDSQKGCVNTAGVGQLIANNEFIANSAAANATYDAVTVSNSSNHVTIQGNLIRGQSTQCRYGINVLAGALEVRMLNNHIVGSGTAPYLDGSTAGQTRVTDTPGLYNYSTAAQTPAAATRTYITGSAILIPVEKMRIGTSFRWEFDMTKTAAGVAASTFDIAVGTNGTTGDTARVSFAKPAGTNVVDNAKVVITAVCRGPLSASGVFAGHFTMTHNLAATGHAVIPIVDVTTVSGTFDVTTASLIVGICITSGAADAITIQMVQAQAWNL